jgi:hypothetical protein
MHCSRYDYRVTTNFDFILMCFRPVCCHYCHFSLTNLPTDKKLILFQKKLNIIEVILRDLKCNFDQNKNSYFWVIKKKYFFDFIWFTKVDIMFFSMFLKFEYDEIINLLYAQEILQKTHQSFSERSVKIGRGFIKILETWKFGLSFNIIRHVFFCFVQNKFLSVLWVLEKFWSCARKIVKSRYWL